MIPTTPDIPAALTALADYWRPTWELSAPSLARQPGLFPDPAQIAAAAKFLGLPDAACAALQDGLALFAREPFLSRLAWHCHFLLCRAGAGDAELYAKSPALPADFHPAAPLFHAYVLLAGLPHCRAENRRRGIGDEITRHTLADLGIWLGHYHRTKGVWGLAQHGWLSGHFRNQLYRLGRLQFRFETFPHRFHAWRQTATGQVALFPGPGERLTAEAFYAAADAECRGNDYEETGEQILGPRLGSDGRWCEAPAPLPRDEWEKILAPGDPVLGLHIAEGEPLTPEACAESLARAEDFFPRHFPERRYAALTCGSWLLDRQLGQLLAPEANIARFQALFHLHPLPDADDRQLQERVFGLPLGERYAGADLERAPRQTSLQRLVVSHLEAGGRFRSGGGIIFPN